MIIDLIVGARPNFVKAAAIIEAAKRYPQVKINLIHTGQHSGLMSDPFFHELQLPTPDHRRLISFNGWESNPLDRLATTISILGGIFREDKPDYAMVVGDTDSTLAGAIAASKTGVPLIHVEAGLRSGNKSRQEEVNRLMIDSVSDICYTTTNDARNTLIAEGHNPVSVKTVGNVMIDTLYRFLQEARIRYPRPVYLKGPYAVLTLHRAENVDDDKVIFPMLDAVREVAEQIDVIFPIHPRLRSRIGAWHNNGRLIFGEPLGYMKFISVLSDATFVMTDSGGVQEETTALGIPCLTLRNETERPETVSRGSNFLIGTQPNDILEMARSVSGLRDSNVTFGKPKFWDGHAADRILADLVGGISN